ncbi:fungal-specific transcription factor domain-containing protein [Apiospora phragmitis]|uniref:Fungal-specific transcription factor domain-containing protein n=1 Tax=Apiospora phragmitis TaxID=2905665 RepID=A0ABR1TQ99_9PEZI
MASGAGRRAQGCWTCKQRKIGCDRGYPACNNCLRTGRECLGYGIRLAWPDQPDGRRRVNRMPDRHYGKQFLNLTYADLARPSHGCAGGSLAVVVQEPPTPRLKCFVPFVPNMHERDTHLMRYYEQRLSGMISTIDINNGFRVELLPMALGNSSEASHGLHNAMLALAALHLWGTVEAFPYKIKALRSLSSSISAGSVGSTATQLATSMMLCVYSVFDETEGSWNMHLNGAKNMLNQLTIAGGNQFRNCFLYTWFLYHEVLGCFSNPHLYGTHGPSSLQGGRDLGLTRPLYAHRTVKLHTILADIIGSLGCSIEVMEVISYVNGLRAADLRGDATQYSAEEKTRKNEEWHRVEAKLATLEQTLHPDSIDKLSQSERTRILITAELYRVAASLYLQRTTSSPQALEARSVYLLQAFQLLGNLKICTSPWPLFVIACESEADEQRIEIMLNLDKMDKERHIGNYYVLREVIEVYWKQHDLQADSTRQSQTKWWDIVDLNTAAPWFI